MDRSNHSWRSGFKFPTRDCILWLKFTCFHSCHRHHHCHHHITSSSWCFQGHESRGTFCCQYNNTKIHIPFSAKQPVWILNFPLNYRLAVDLYRHCLSLRYIQIILIPLLPKSVYFAVFYKHFISDAVILDLCCSFIFRGYSTVHYSTVK